jgi:hypothetical protein
MPESDEKDNHPLPRVLFWKDDGQDSEDADTNADDPLIS